MGKEGRKGGLRRAGAGRLPPGRAVPRHRGRRPHLPCEHVIRLRQRRPEQLRDAGGVPAGHQCDGLPAAPPAMGPACLFS